MLALLSAIVLSPVPVDLLHLVRAYKADETQVYELKVTMERDGATMKVDGEVVFKVKKISEDGADIVMSVRKFALQRDGEDTGAPAPDEMTSPFDKLGLPHVMSTENQAWVYIVSALAGLVPGKDVELGNGFEVSWSSKDKSFTTNGKGKAVEVVDLDGVKAVKLDYDLEVKPGQDTPGIVKCTSFVSQDGASPISSSGTVSVDSTTLKFTVKRLKA